jgi:hypothetical protein
VHPLVVRRRPPASLFEWLNVSWADVRAAQRNWEPQSETFQHLYWYCMNLEDQMPIIAKDKGGTYTPAPEGTHHVVCVDVVDLGLVTSEKWGTAHKITIVWQLEDVDPAKKRRYTASKRYTLSLNAKATLCKDLESWRGKKFTREEKDGFDVEKLVGANAQIQIVHNVTDDATYANVATIMGAPKKSAKLVPVDYVRVIDRKDEADPPAHDADDVPEFPEEEPLPF